LPPPRQPAYQPPARHRTARQSSSPEGPGRDLDGLHVLGGEHGVERLIVFRVPIPDEEPEGGRPLAEIHQQVAGLLRGPRRGRVRGHAEDVHGAGAGLHHEQRVEPAQADGVEVEEVRGQHAVRLVA
jgi:hypothetical protein